MSGAIDWDGFVRERWERRPALLHLGAPLVSPERLFRLAAAASAPFRFGTRFGATPDVLFFAGEARLRAPGALLPGEADPDLERYVRRASRRAGPRGFRLLIERPFLLDFDLWDGVRSFLRGLLARVGVPVLPVRSGALLGQFAGTPEGGAHLPRHSTFTAVLRGILRVSFRPPGGRALVAGPGDIVYAPSGARAAAACEEPALAVHVHLPVQGHGANDPARDVLLALLAQHLPHDERVPYLPYPAHSSSSASRGAGPEPLLRVARAAEALARSPDLLSALKIAWARRVSACGLEPVPPPREARALRDSDRVRARAGAQIIRMADRGVWICAANGHAFPVRPGSASARALELLSTRSPQRLGELYRLARGRGARAELRALLEGLRAVRAVELTGG